MTPITTRNAAAPAGEPHAPRDFLARYFRFAEGDTNYRREVIGGVTTFRAMS